MKSLLALLSSLVLTFGLAFPASAADPASTTKAASTEVAEAHAKININTASAQELTKLKGVGEKKAEAIIAWRNENGNFKTLEDLMEVKGIGEATFEANRDKITL